MKKIKTIIVTILAVLIISLNAAGNAAASDGQSAVFDDEVVFFGTFTLETGETLDGSLVVFGGAVSLEEGSVVTGDVIVFGGNVTASGTLGSNLVAVGGVVRLNATAVVQGDLIAPGTVVRRDEDSRVFGQIITENIPDIEVPGFDDLVVPEPPATTQMPEVIPSQPTFFDQVAAALRPVVSFFSVIARALIFSAVAVMVGLVLPKNTTVVRETIEEQPVLSGGFGVLSVGVFVAALIMLALLSITIILIPLTVSLIVLISMAITLGLGFGLIAVGGELGRRMMVAVRKDWTPPLQIAIGTFSLAFLLGLLSLGLWGVLGVLLWMITGAIGLGSVLLTRFGTQAYVPSTERGTPGSEKAGKTRLLAETEAVSDEAEGWPDGKPEEEGVTTQETDTKKE